MLAELLNYAGPEYSFEIREKALEYLYSMGVANDEFIKNLVNASTHHYWRFRNAAREMLDDFMNEDAKKEKVLALFSSYSEKEKRYERWACTMGYCHNSFHVIFLSLHVIT